MQRCYFSRFQLLPYLALITLTACCNTPPVRQALNEEAIAKVQGEIKRQVAVYLAASASLPAEDPKDFWCGAGLIGFDISTIKAELTVTDEQINSGGIKAKIPIKAIEIDPSGSKKTDVTNTQILTYNLWALDSSRQVDLPKADLDNAPIAKVLMSLRRALINSSRKSAPGPQACFTDYNPDKASSDAGNTFKLGLSFVNDVTGGFELSVWVLDLTATAENKSTTGNMLTVSFVQRGLKDIQLLQDEVSTQCKFPEFDKPLCVIATGALNLITTPAAKITAARKDLEDQIAALCKPAKPGDPPTPDCKRARLVGAKAIALIDTGLSDI